MIPHRPRARGCYRDQPRNSYPATGPGTRAPRRRELPVATERSSPPPTGGEREMLRAFLDYHRATLAMKCDGLSDEDLRRQSMPPSTLSFGGPRRPGRLRSAAPLAVTAATSASPGC
jgi:Protein of unknown function (DUF664)